MESIKFSVNFLLVSSFLVLGLPKTVSGGYLAVPKPLAQPQGTFHERPVQQQHHDYLLPSNSAPLHQEIHTASQTQEHQTVQKEYPPGSQTQLINSHPFQIKYDKNSIPVLSHGSNGLATDQGDRAANYGEFPYKVQVRNNGEFAAGGTLVKSPITGKHIIITALHVLDDTTQKNALLPIQNFELKMGVIGRESVGQTRKIKALLTHPDYVKLNSESHRPIFNDIAILIPESDFEENYFVRTIDLPSQENKFGPLAGNFVEVKGWGKGREAGHDDVSKTLRVVNLPVWNNEQCRKVYWQESGKDIITDAHFCAAHEAGGMDTCQGDSGGGAFSWDHGKKYLAGIVSWGRGCGKPGYPGVYVKVTKYMDWIKQTLYNYEVHGILPPPLREIRY